MSLANEDRGSLVGAFIVEEGDEVMSITHSGQVVRSPINEDFRPTGRSTMGVKFVSPKEGDSVAVVARSVERSVEEAVEEAVAEAGEEAAAEAAEDVVQQLENSGAGDPGATIDEGSAATESGTDAAAPDTDADHSEPQED
jgi:DNA gyrase subunit A